MSRHPLVILDPTLPPTRAERWTRHPDWPQTRAVLAASRQDPKRARALLHELERRLLVHRQDIRSEAVLVDAAMSVGLALPQMQRDWYDEQGLIADAPRLAAVLLAA